MSPEGPWRFCDLGSDTTVALYIKADFGLNGYTIFLSDLCHVWSESLDRSGLNKRAIDDACNIDPSEDDQCGILVERLRGAIDHQPDTSIKLRNSNDDDLSLLLNAALPTPLPALHWRVDLSFNPASKIRSLLVTPLLSQASLLQLQIEDLLSELADKDRVISKITDRLEASGNDLTTVFPSASNIKTSRKKSQRNQLSRHVRGLGDFDVSVWRSKWLDVPVPLPTGQSLDKIFQGLADANCESPQSVPERWWRDLATKHKAPSRRPALVTTSASNSSSDELVDNDFQHQATPPARRQPCSASPRVVHSPSKRSGMLRRQQTESRSNENTDAEEEDVKAHEAIMPELIVQKSHLSHPSKTTSLNDTSMRREHLRSSSSESTDRDANNQLPTTAGRLAIPVDSYDGDSSTTDDDLDSQAVPSRPPHAKSAAGKSKHDGADVTHRTRTADSDHELSPPPPAPSPMKSRLGTIGGARRQPEISSRMNAESSSQGRSKIGSFGGKLSARPTPDPGTPPTSSPIASTLSHGKLGTMSGKDMSVSPSSRSRSARRESAHGSEQVQPRGRFDVSEKTIEDSSQARETSAERANRRRIELKREIEQQAKAPVKKKRRF